MAGNTEIVQLSSLDFGDDVENMSAQNGLDEDDSSPIRHRHPLFMKGAADLDFRPTTAGSEFEEFGLEESPPKVLPRTQFMGSEMMTVDEHPPHAADNMRGGDDAQWPSLDNDEDDCEEALALPTLGDASRPGTAAGNGAQSLAVLPPPAGGGSLSPDQQRVQQRVQQQDGLVGLPDAPALTSPTGGKKDKDGNCLVM